MRNNQCDFYLKGKCNSNYRKGRLCNLSKCPWKSGGNYAMAVVDQSNRIKKGVRK